MNAQRMGLFLLLLIGSVAMSQVTTWTRTAFEAGVAYQETDQVAVTTINCPPYGWAADVFDRSVTWTDNGQPMSATANVPHHATEYKGAVRDLVANGT
jgi:hypothetical protein